MDDKKFIARKAKIQKRFAMMDDTCWRTVVDEIPVINNELTKKLNDFSKAIENLICIYICKSMDLIEERYTGYEKMLNAKTYEELVTIEQNFIETTNELKQKKTEISLEILERKKELESGDFLDFSKLNGFLLIKESR